MIPQNPYTPSPQVINSDCKKQEAGTSDSVEGNGQEMISTLTHLLEHVAEDPRKVKNKFW